ncbi:hypothetical protein BH11ARM2_BH11ARM2_08530 [soil metagenome]
MVWFLALLGIYLAVLLVVGWISVHPPRTPIFASPGSTGTPQETIRLEGEAGPLVAWWVPAEHPIGSVLLVHGYCMNRAELAGEARLLWERGFSCLLLDLRGHGQSHTAPCGFGWRERRDVAVGARWLRERVPGPVGLFGSSMGAAASAFAQAEDGTLGDFLILDSSYDRLSSAILGWWRFLGGRSLMWALAPTTIVAAPLAKVNPFKIQVEEACRKIQVPTLIMHGLADNLALPKEAQENFDALTGPKEIAWFKGMRHSEARWEKPAEYRLALLTFLRDHHFVDD